MVSADKVVALANQPRRHHYIPVFYLKRWIGDDGRLCEFSRPHDRVKPKRKHPSGTAYGIGLYSIPGFPPEAAEIMERVFMREVDDSAAQALNLMLSSVSVDVLTERHRMAWARFLYSLILRTPEHLEWARQKLNEMRPELVDAEKDRYLERRQEGDPETFEEFRKQFLANPAHIEPTRFLHRFISNGLAARHIMNMRWSIAYFPSPRFGLLTSDRPLVMTNGFARADGHLGLPISPSHIFLASNSENVEQSIHRLPEREIIQTINRRVVEQAVKFAYGTDDSQLRFVQNRFGKRLPSTPLG